MQRRSFMSLAAIPVLPIPTLLSLDDFKELPRAYWDLWCNDQLPGRHSYESKDLTDLRVSLCIYTLPGIGRIAGGWDFWSSFDDYLVPDGTTMDQLVEFHYRMENQHE